MPFANIRLVPKDPRGPLRVLVLGRVSTIHQDLENIQASYNYVENYLRQIYQGPLHLKHLGERGSGMRTDRATIVEAEEEIASGAWDLVIMEELSRAYRNPRHQLIFVQDAVDARTRVISIGDNLDTADEQWETALQVAALRHGLVIPDTRRRVRRTAHHAFHRGQMVLKVRFGYRRLSLEEADSGQFGPRGLRIARDPAATPIIREMARRVRDGATYQAVARWLNDEQVAPGTYCTTGRWSCRLVQRLLRDPILRGVRTFGTTQYQPVYRTGRSVRRKNPDGPQTETYPELAHLSEEEHHELVRFMDQIAARYPRATGPDHPLSNRPRSRAIWPAQHPRCAVCDALLHRHGPDALQCPNAYIPRAKPCWNHVQVKCPTLRDKMLAVLIGHCERVPEFRRALADAAWAELEARQRRHSRAARSRDDEIAELQKQATNPAKAIATKGPLESLMTQLDDVERDLKDARRRSEPAADQADVPTLNSRADLDRHLEAALQQFALDLGRIRRPDATHPARLPHPARAGADQRPGPPAGSIRPETLRITGPTRPH
jgi:DNA invertase Pin-like site-specific DNA recombinase